MRIHGFCLPQDYGHRRSQYHSCQCFPPLSDGIHAACQSQWPKRLILRLYLLKALWEGVGHVTEVSAGAADGVGPARHNKG